MKEIQTMLQFEPIQNGAKVMRYFDVQAKQIKI